MKWYAAHALLLVAFRDGDQDHFPIWENIYLVEAPSDDAAFAAAETAAQRFTNVDDESFTWSGRPARWMFQGVRKIIACDLDKNGRLYSGSELTFLRLDLKSKEDLRKFLDCETTTLSIDA